MEELLRIIKEIDIPFAYNVITIYIYSVKLSA